MTDLSPTRRRELKALAHHLDPVVAIAGNGLSDAVLKEIDVALNAHGLIKIRVHGDDRALRSAYLEEICLRTGASAVQSIGKLLVVWREKPAAEPAPARREPRSAKPLTKRAAQVRAETGRSPKPSPRKPASGKPAPRGKPARSRAPGGAAPRAPRRDVSRKR